MVSDPKLPDGQILIYNDGELDPEATIRSFRIVQTPLIAALDECFEKGAQLGNIQT